MITIVVDTREQQAWAFPEHLVKIVRGTLRAGDYALLNDNLFSIERKSIDDFVGTVSSGWERFQRELIRMCLYHIKVIIIEGSMMDIINHNYNHPEVSPHFVLKRISELVIEHSVCVLFGDNPITAAGLGYKILEERQRQLES